MIRLALALAAALPIAAVSQPVPPAAAAEPAPAPAPVAAPVAAPAPSASGVTVDIGGWMVFNSYFNWGGSNAVDLPQRAAGLRGEVAAGMQARQSRVRANLGLPGGGLLGDAKLKGLVEVDFMGGNVNGDQSLTIVRFRHGWVSATWADLGNLTLTVGQTWGLFTGPYFAQSLGHLAVPRFAGAGFLFRRAPQVRLSGDLGGDLGLLWAVGAMAPMDKATVPAPVTSAASVGERSGVPDLEGRAAVVFRPGRKNAAEVGVSFHLGQDRYLLNAGATNDNESVRSAGLSVDAKLDVAGFTLLGAAFQGRNLDILNTAGAGVRTAPATGTITSAEAVETRGVWGQLQYQATPALQLVAGGGLERPTASDLAAGATVVRRNGQASAGVVVNLTPRWRCAAEVTRYVTTYNAADSRYELTQAELSTLFAF